MNPDLRKLFAWIDQRTGKRLDACHLTIELSDRTEVPSILRSSFLKFKKSSWWRREALVDAYLKTQG